MLAQVLLGNQITSYLGNTVAETTRKGRKERKLIFIEPIHFAKHYVRNLLSQFFKRRKLRLSGAKKFFNTY